MSAFTAEPWELCDRGDYGDFDGDSQVICAGDRRLAVVHVSDDETAANARLMVVAPELLEALKTARRRMMKYGESRAEIDEMDAIIRKAEGS